MCLFYANVRLYSVIQQIRNLMSHMSLSCFSSNILCLIWGFPLCFAKVADAPNAQSSGSGCPLQFTLPKGCSAKIQKGASCGRSFCISLSSFWLRLIFTRIPKPARILINTPILNKCKTLFCFDKLLLIFAK